MRLLCSQNIKHKDFFCFKVNFIHDPEITDTKPMLLYMTLYLFFCPARVFKFLKSFLICVLLQQGDHKISESISTLKGIYINKLITVFLIFPLFDKFIEVMFAINRLTTSYNPTHFPQFSQLVTGIYCNLNSCYFCHNSYYRRLAYRYLVILITFKGPSAVKHFSSFQPFPHL